MPVPPELSILSTLSVQQLDAASQKGPVRLIMVGVGNRGWQYAQFAKENPSRARVVAVAEPREWRRTHVCDDHSDPPPPERLVADWRSLLEMGDLSEIADCVVVAVHDHLHCEVATAFMSRGIHCLCEKPMATSAADCATMVACAKENGVILAVCHVMRYTPYTQKIKELCSSGSLGDITCIQHLEPVGFWHYAHSYVRGIWRRRDENTFILMAKSCHDVDWLRYVSGTPISRVSSFGSLRHFNHESKPKEAGAAKRCTECKVSKSCSYSAVRIYADAVERGHTGFPVNVITDEPPDIENVAAALEQGPYGRCVYECDNTEPDNQVVNIEFAAAGESGQQVSTASFTMAAFSTEVCQRKTRIFGSHGQLECDGRVIEWRNFGSGEVTRYEPRALSKADTACNGHDGADWFLMDRFVAAVCLGDPSLVLSGPDETLESHMAVFAAEEARLRGTVISVPEFSSSFNGANDE